MVPPQQAYDRRCPNGSGRRKLDDRVIHVYRVYQKVKLFNQVGPPLSSATSVGRSVAGGIRAVRSFLRDPILSWLGPSDNGPLAGKQLIAEYRFPLIIERITESPEVRSRFGYTQDGYFIDTPFQGAPIARGGRGITRWTITGRTHWAPASVNGVLMDGDAAVKSFKEMIDDLFYPHSGSPTDYELWWINLNAPVSGDDPFGEFEWKIWPLSGLQTEQEASRPFQRRFQFGFLGLESNRDRAKATDGFLAGLTSKDLLRKLLGVIPGGDAFAAILSDVFTSIEEFKGLINDITLIIQRVVDFLNGVTAVIKGTVALVRGVISSVKRLIGKIEEGISIARNLPNVFGDQLDLLRDEFGGLLNARGPEKGFVAADEARKIRDFLSALAANPQWFAATLQGPQDLRSEHIPPDIGLERFAQLANVDPAQLIEVNGLRFPFIDQREHPQRKIDRLERERDRLTAVDAQRVLDGLPPLYTAQILHLNSQIVNATNEAADFPSEPGVLYAGDVLSIPYPRATPNNIVSVARDRIISLAGREAVVRALVNRQPTLEDWLFGFDLLLNDRGDLEWNLAQRDLRIVGGLDNIALAFGHYMRLPVGSLRFAPNVGNFAWNDLGNWQSPGSNRLLAYSIHRTLQQDPRVTSVKRVSAVMYAGVAHVQFDAVLTNGKEITDLRVPLGVA